MAQDWLADVRKYAPGADDKIVSKVVRHCGIALHKPDSALVSFSDAKETGRVRDGFLRKKLALTVPDDELNAGIAAVGERMKGDRTKNRVTVYYLLAEHFGKLDLFGGAAGAAPPVVAPKAVKTSRAAAPVAKPAAKPAKAATLKPATAAPRATAATWAAKGGAPRAMMAGPTDAAPPRPTPIPSAPPIAASEKLAADTPARPVADAPASRFRSETASSDGSRWWLWLLLALGIMAVFVFLKRR